MKIYSDKITEHDVRRAFTIARDDHHADIWIEDIRTWKPRKYLYGTEVFPRSHHGSRATGHVPARASGPRDGYPRAASWDDWGYVIAELYRIDPDARVGFYDSKADFISKVTKYRRPESSLAFLDIFKS
jgi:hypothetical protein